MWPATGQLFMLQGASTHRPCSATRWWSWGWGVRPGTTVRVAHCEPGSEPQVEFGRMGLVPPG
jgi:hypothetical protein